jgi:hypothetical protein
MSDDRATMTYEPLDTLKRVADNVWVVDGPLIRFGMPWPKMPFPTRMTVIRLANSGLFIHSPTRLTEDLRAEIAAIGEPRWIIAPNRIHYWWTPLWKAAFPDADVYLAPRVKEQAGDRINFPYLALDRESGYPWDAEIATLPVAGSYMTEVTFFHRASRTLLLTDLIENFEPGKVPFWMRWLVRLGGCLDPNGGMPRDMRLTFAKQKPELRAAIETMIGWRPERIILAHGRWYEENAPRELRRAFHWVFA